jgi:PAS domain S-box-containing protein
MSEQQNPNALKSQNNVLKEMINGSWNAIGIIALDSSIKYINKAFSPVLGFLESELLKMKLVDIALPKSKEPLLNLLEENLTNQYKNRLTIGCLRKDNQLVYLDIVIKLMSNNQMFVINAIDVTSDVAEKQLINKFIIQFQMDAKGKILGLSEAFSRISGYTYEKLVYTDYSELLHNNTPIDVKNEFTTHIQSGKAWKGNLTLKKKDNNPFYVDFSSKPTKNKYGDIIGHTAVMMDITSEIQLQKNEVILQEKLVDGEERLGIMAETMRTVAHEWRQPLNAISLAAQGLLFELDFDDTINKDTITEVLGQISKSTEGLSKVIESFQSITELKGSKKKRHIKDILLESIRVADLEEAEYIKEEYGDSVSFRTYPKELSSAISSILINAKEITANKADKIIFIKSYMDENNIICELSNNGGHIPEELKDKIFTPYFSTKDERNGVGLSLYTCKVIIELHLKGDIEIINSGNDIVTFKLSFPIGALEE